MQVSSTGIVEGQRIEGFVWAGAAGCVAGWVFAWLGRPTGEAAFCAALAALGCLGFARWGRRRVPPATLRWDGRGWSIAVGHESDVTALDAVHVRIDTGHSLLLSLSGTGVPAALRWWWIRCGGAAGVATPDFRDLCTALYAQRSSVVPPEIR